MRRKELAVFDRARLTEVLTRCKVCRLGISDEVPYIVPMNFGFAWGDRLTLYFHSARQGRKIDLLKRNPRVSFEMDCDHQLVAGATACSHSYRYSCLMGVGAVRFIEDAAGKIEALKAIMRQTTGIDDYEYDEPAVGGVAVFAVDAAEVIGKMR